MAGGSEAGAGWWRDRGLRNLAILGVVLVALGAWLIIELTDDDIATYGPSMRPTITGETEVRIDFGAYRSSNPELGEIVALQGPKGLGRGSCGAPHPEGSACPRSVEDYQAVRLLKRVVGLPDDRIAFAADGHLLRNGSAIEEPYIRSCPDTCGLPVAISVPPGHVFVAGDNRRRSTDSRRFGAVPLEAIDGRVAIAD